MAWILREPIKSTQRKAWNPLTNEGSKGHNRSRSGSSKGKGLVGDDRDRMELRGRDPASDIATSGLLWPGPGLTDTAFVILVCLDHGTRDGEPTLSLSVKAFAPFRLFGAS